MYFICLSSTIHKNIFYSKPIKCFVKYQNFFNDRNIVILSKINNYYKNYDLNIMVGW